MPRQDPTIALDLDVGSGTMVRVEPGATIDVRLTLQTRDLDQDRCRLTHLADPDAPEIADSKEALLPLDAQTLALGDGYHRFVVACPSAAGTLDAHANVRVADGAPIRCADWTFPETAPTAATFDELAAGVVGSWEGCLDTPWVPTYWVELTFRSDGTYSSKADEVLDGWIVPGLYYGTDQDDPNKRWRIEDIQASGLGTGAIDVAFDGGTMTRDDLRAIRLMGDRLEFEMFHLGSYGPLVFQLVRA